MQLMVLLAADQECGVYKLDGTFSSINHPAHKAIFKSALLKLLEQHNQIYVLLFYHGLITITVLHTHGPGVCGGSCSVRLFIHPSALQRTADV